MALDTNRLVRETFVARVEHHSVLGSTNDRAKQCAVANSGPLPLLIVADQQTAGRGRGANRWWTGCGSLALSLLLDGRTWGPQPAVGPLLSLAAAVAVSQLVAPLLPGQSVGIHWPNDVFAAGKKLAGILVEVPPGGLYVVGAGLNLNNSLREGPEELQSTAVSLLDLTGRQHDRTDFIVLLLERFASLLNDLSHATDGICQRANALCLQRGKTLSVATAGKTLRGVCRGIAPDGALLLDTPKGLERVVSGVVLRGELADFEKGR
jgi:BirA family biotin operon repressor/biotin-[acetyl-CoA-carboxylase] ligase